MNAMDKSDFAAEQGVTHHPVRRCRGGRGVVARCLETTAKSK